MAIRLCIIGNSHIAALKSAWESMSEQFPDIEITFFGSHRNTLATLEVRGRSLVSDNEAVTKTLKWTSDGKGAIDVDAYDFFLIHGLVNIQTILNEANGAGCFPSDRPFEGDPVSAAAINVEFLVDRMLGGRLAKKLSPFGKPVVISPRPYRSEELLEHGNDPEKSFCKGLFKSDGSLIAAAQIIIDKWNSYLASDDVLKQPEETITGSIFTKKTYSTDSMRLSENLTKHPETDCTHMNATYGRLVIREAIGMSRARVSNISDHPKVETQVVEKRPAKQDKRNHPYKDLPETSFWKRSVEAVDAQDITGWYRKKFSLDESNIATAGSCFAQHIGRRLRRSGFRFVDTEPAPSAIPAASHADFGYGLYSARYGNIYTTRQLLQLFERAFGEFAPKEIYWEKGDGYVDPFRPTIQPEPFESLDELIDAREQHLSAVRDMFESTDVFVFTLGLTETWASAVDGSVFPVAPGVAGGSYDAARYKLLNLSYPDVMNDLKQFINKARAVRPGMKFLLTVSPVPLMATATSQHVVAATTYSKSVLRAVAGLMAERRRDVDYFPSFEIINSHVMEGRFYESDKRSVKEQGVDHVMKQFFAEHIPPATTESTADQDHSYLDDADDENEVVCDEQLLAAFGGEKDAAER